jgi:hypothetical protein
MKRRNRTQIIIPNIVAASTRTPLTLSGAIPLAWTTRATMASSTGPPTTSAMKIVRRDQSISPSDRSKMRMAPAHIDVAP